MNGVGRPPGVVSCPEDTATSFAAQTHVRCDGVPGAPVIVFIHALGTDLRLWDVQASHFGATHRVVRYDVMGHGGTPLPSDGVVSLARLVDQLLRTIDATGGAPVTLVGTSMGAVIGLAAAFQRPCAFLRLVLCGATLWRYAHAAHDLRSRAVHADGGRMHDVVLEMLPRWFPGTETADPAAIAMVREMLLQASPGGYAACANALATYDLRPALAAVRHPVLLLSGAHDGEVPAQFESLARQGAKVRAHCIPAAGHFPNIDQAALFNALLEEFLKQLPAAIHSSPGH